LYPAPRHNNKIYALRHYYIIYALRHSIRKLVITDTSITGLKL